MLPFAANDALPDLPGRLTDFVLGVRVVKLLQANGTLRAVRVFEATVETFVTHAVAIAITRLLVEDAFNLGRKFVGVSLVGILGVLPPELILAQEGREFRALRGSSLMIGGHGCGSRPFLLGNDPRCGKQESGQKKEQ